MLNPFIKDQVENKTESKELNSTASQTIRIIGNELIELKSVVEQQNRIINKLANEVKLLMDANQTLRDDYQMMVIDQRDLGSQIRAMKIHNIAEREMPAPRENPAPDYEDILDANFPGHRNSSLLHNEVLKNNNVYERKIETPESMNQRARVNPENQASTKYVFERLPKLLNLSD